MKAKSKPKGWFTPSFESDWIDACTALPKGISVKFSINIDVQRPTLKQIKEYSSVNKQKAR